MYSLEELEKMKKWDFQSMSREELLAIGKQLCVKTDKTLKCTAISRGVYTAQQLIKSINEFLEKNNVDDCPFEWTQCYIGGGILLSTEKDKTNEELAHEIKCAIDNQISTLKRQKEIEAQREKETRELYESLKKKFEDQQGDRQ